MRRDRGVRGVPTAAMTKPQKVELQLRRSVERALGRGDLVVRELWEARGGVALDILRTAELFVSAPIARELWGGWVWDVWPGSPHPSWASLGTRLRRDYCETSS